MKKLYALMLLLPILVATSELQAAERTELDAEANTSTSSFVPVLRSKLGLTKIKAPPLAEPAAEVAKAGNDIFSPADTSPLSESPVSSIASGGNRISPIQTGIRVLPSVILKPSEIIAEQRKKDVARGLVQEDDDGKLPMYFHPMREEDAKQAVIVYTARGKRKIGVGTPMLSAAEIHEQELGYRFFDQDENGQAYLHRQIAQQNLRHTRGIELVVRSVHKDDLVVLLNMQDNAGKTPLHYAVENHWTLVEDLFALGSRTDIPDNDGVTAADMIMENLSLDAIIKDSDDLNAVKKIMKWIQYFGLDCRAFVNRNIRFGKTALYYAAGLQCWEIAAYLISQGADVSIRADDGYTPLDLIQAFLSVDFSSVQGTKDALQRDAALARLDAVISLATQAGIDTATIVNQKDSNGKTMLHYAAEKKWWGMIKTLIHAKASATIPDSQGVTAHQLIKDNLSLHNVAMRNSDLHELRAAIYLILKGSKRRNNLKFFFNKKDEQGKTALHYAVEYSCVDIIREILAPTIVTGDGTLVFSEDAMEEILDKNVIDNSGHTPLDYIDTYKRKLKFELMSLGFGHCMNGRF